MKVLNIDPDSPLFGYIRPGYKLVSINGDPVQDVIDFRFRTIGDNVSIKFSDPKGEEFDFDFEEIEGDLGITLDDHRVKFCKNDCIFCFISQQPQGMRRVLYFREEDYRLSFTHGNFITLSNTTQADLDRIIEQRLSPLYVSVHATDDKLRRCMLRNEKLPDILPRLKLLTENGIIIHSQVVLCPDVNDGKHLEKTINDLAALYPGVESLAVVPVGLTKYRKRLAELRAYNAEEANQIIDRIEEIQKQLFKVHGTRFVWPGDEFYVQADREFPKLKEYEIMSQFENGIGMAREFISSFNRRRAGLKNIRSDKRVMMFTGFSAYPFLSKDMIPYVKETLGLDLSLERISNRFWGESVTVSGLLTGQDLLRRARALSDKFDTLILPPNCLNNDNLVLDNLPLEQFEEVLKKPVLVGQYNFAATIKEAFA